MSNRKRPGKAFDRDALARICAMHETEFGDAYDMTTVNLAGVQRSPDDYYHYRDNGSNILAVAHLDTVQPHHKREAHFVQTAGGLVVYSGALDDRLGAYIILDMLPNLGLNFDVLLTVGEESGQSTAAFFEPPPGKSYDWMIEFDRGGTDVVMYQYEDEDTTDAVRDCGARVGDGIFSDISYMEHLGIKGFNWGVGYKDYHSPRAHAYVDDTLMMVGHFLKFHGEQHDVYMPHRPHERAGSGPREYETDGSFTWDGERYDRDGFYLGPVDDFCDDTFFDRDFIENPTAEDLRRLEAELDREYLERLERDA